MKESTDKSKNNDLSVLGILKSFRYWPNLFKLLWETHKGYFFLVLFLNLLNGLLPASSILALQYLVNMIQKIYTNGYEKTYFTDVVPVFLIFISITLLTGILNTILETYKQLYQKLLSNTVNIKVIEKANKLSYISFENAEIYNKLQRARQESTYKPYQIFEVVMSIIKNTIVLVSISGILVFWNWWFTLILICLPLISAWPIIKNEKDMFQIDYERTEETRKQFYYYYLLTTDTTVKEVKTFELGNLLKNKYSQLFRKFYKQDSRIIFRKLKIDLLFQLIFLVFVIVVQYFIVMDAVTGKIPIGSLIAYFQAVTTTQKTSNELMYKLFNMYQNNLYMTQLFSFLNIVEKDYPYLESSTKRHFEEKLYEEKGIRFVNVSFKYPGRKDYTLRNVNFSIKPGETIALVGSNGSGKSTIVKLLTRLYTDYEGSILLDGKPIESYNTTEYINKISNIFQDFTKYELTVRENIGYGDYKNEKDEFAIINAAKKSGSYDMISQLPNQLDTQLGKTFANGMQLSGGQWQRIAIARTYMRNAELFILDEPTSALDPMAEEEVFNDFQKHTVAKMGLFITHRYSTVKYATKIMVLDKGSVVEMGTHQELIFKKGLYYKLYMLQAKNYFENKVEY